MVIRPTSEYNNMLNLMYSSPLKLLKQFKKFVIPSIALCGSEIGKESVYVINFYMATETVVQILS